MAKSDYWLNRFSQDSIGNLGQYDDEDRAYVEFKRCELKSEIYDNENLPKKVAAKIETQKEFYEDYLEQAVYFTDWIQFYLSRPHKHRRIT